jgi:tRNA(Ile)-lysidine synthase
VGGSLLVPEAGAEIHTRLVFRKEGGAQEYFGDPSTLLAWNDTPHQVVVRNVSPGTRFRPSGSHAERKMKDFFIRARIPRSQRVRLPLLEVDGVIAWVAGQTIDERFCPSERTGILLQVQVEWERRGVSADS